MKTSLLPLSLLKQINPKTATRFAPLRRRFSTMSPTIEHVVLFHVKEGTENSQVSPILAGLNSLKSLDTVLHISAGPIHRLRSTSLNFTHFLHSRYRSKEDLATYSAHPAHMDVVRASAPIFDDIMAVDWVADNIDGSSGHKPGSAMRVQFVKLKEWLGEKEKEEVLRVIGGAKEKVNGMEEFTYGENFSARSKGFSVGSVRVFPGIGELDADDQSGEIDKVRDFVDDVVIVDYVVPLMP